MPVFTLSAPVTGAPQADPGVEIIVRHSYPQLNIRICEM